MFYTDVQHLETKHEMIQELTVSNNLNYYPQVLYSIPLKDLKSGDILQVTSAYEVTNEKPYTLMISSHVILGVSVNSIDGELIDEARGYNLTKVGHHGTGYHIRQYKLTKDYPGTLYLNTVVWSASPDANPNLGDTLHIEKNYGHLDVIKYSINSIK